MSSAANTAVQHAPGSQTSWRRYSPSIPSRSSPPQGVWLLNSRGERVLDLYGGHAVAALGYGHPGWTEALISAQARSCNFQTNAIPMRIRVRAAERLVRFSQLDFTSVFFVNSGAEANENALRLAFRMTSRPHVAAVEGGFHGRTAAAGAVTWGSDSWYGFPRKPFDVSFMPRGDIGAIAAHVTESTAAVIVEPVQGLAGAIDLGKPYLEALRRRCDEVGALLIFDEVQCGFGRVGLSVRRQPVRRHARHDHGREGARQRLSVRGTDGLRQGVGEPQPRAARHDLRRRPDGLRRDRGGDRRHRVGGPARERARACRTTSAAPASWGR